MHFAAYGTLIFPPTAAALFGREIESEPVTLRDVQRYYVKGDIFPVMIEEPGQSCTGRVYFDLLADEMKVLEAFECDYYARVNTELETASRGKITARIYILNSKDPELLTNDLWEPAEFEKRHLEEWIEVCCRFREDFFRSTGNSGV